MFSADQIADIQGFNNMCIRDRKYNVDAAKAKDMCNKKDKQRQSYYNYYSSKKWGRADSYDLCINSSVLGQEGTVRLIKQYVEDFEARQK